MPACPAPLAADTLVALVNVGLRPEKQHKNKARKGWLIMDSVLRQILKSGGYAMKIVKTGVLYYE